MKQKKVLSTVVMAIMLLSVVMAVVPTTEAADNPDYFIAGQVFVNGMPTDGVEVILSVPGQENRSNISYYNEIYDLHGIYKVGIHANLGQNVTFTLHFGGNYVTPVPETLLLDQPSLYFYVNINLSITNTAPGPITLVAPSDGSTVGSENQATLRVTVNDPDGHTMDVEFYDASDNLIGTANAVPNGSNATVTWSGLSAGTIYSWYAVADDGLETTQSSTWSFKTKTASHADDDTGDDDDDTGDDDDFGGGDSSVTAGFSWEQQVGLEVEFTDESTGPIVSWLWDFGDGSTSTEQNLTHTYTGSGIYTVTLTVSSSTDEDSHTEEIEIFVGNNPPTKPVVTGDQTGTKNTDYTYIATSTDPDNHSISYTLDWGDGTNTTSDFLANGTSYSAIHKWTSAGKYEIWAEAIDDFDDGNGTLSGKTYMTVLIDAINVKELGYMTDNDPDGTYDTFHGADAETAVEKQTDGTYLIDNDGDGNWDYIYDPETDTLTEYTEGPIESSDSMLQMLALGVLITIIFFLIIAYVLKKRK